MKRKVFVVVIILVVLLGGFIAYKTSRQVRPLQSGPVAVSPRLGLQDPPVQSSNNLPVVQSVHPHPTPQFVQMETQATPEISPPAPEKKLAPMRIYTASATPTPPPEEEEWNPSACYGRKIKCKWVDPVDSSNISTPIIGLVTEDLKDYTKTQVLIPYHAEVHGKAQVDRERTRIAAEGTWVIVFNDGTGREMVVKGQAQDREDTGPLVLASGGKPIDPDVRHWGQSDGGAGLHGTIIQTATTMDQIKVFVAAWLAAAAGSVQGYSTNIFGGVTANPNAPGIAGIQGAIVNPPSQATETVMNHWAQTIMDSIQRDGFYIRVPPAKEFYLYVEEDILLSRATVGGSRRRAQARAEYLEDRKGEEEMTQPRSEREQRPQIPYGPVMENDQLRQEEQAAIQAEEAQAQPTPPPQK
jgi:hypothetical protein